MNSASGQIPLEYTTTYGYRSLSAYQPTYLENVTLDLSSVPVSEMYEQGNTPLIFAVDRNYEVMCERLSEKTTLDMGQARA